MKKITNFAVVATACALAGCAWVQTPKDYAASQGYSLITVHGKKYYCRREQPEIPELPAAGVECLTRTQLSAKVAQLNSARFGTGGLPLDDAQFLQFRSPDVSPGWQGSNDPTGSGRGLASATGPR